MGSVANTAATKIAWGTLLTKYSAKHEQMMKRLSAMDANTSGTKPAEFLMMQFEMSQVTQMGDTISNLISQVNAMINNAIRNVGK